MNTFISILIGGFMWIALMWLLLAVMRLDKTPTEEDDEARIAAASKPAPLEHRHVKAGTAWGVDQ